MPATSNYTGNVTLIAPKGSRALSLHPTATGSVMTTNPSKINTDIPTVKSNSTNPYVRGNFTHVGFGPRHTEAF